MLHFIGILLILQQRCINKRVGFSNQSLQIMLMIKTGQTFANSAIGDDQKVFQDIHLSYRNIAIFERSIEHLDTELAGLATKSIECRASGSAEEILSVLKDFF